MNDFFSKTKIKCADKEKCSGEKKYNVLKNRWYKKPWRKEEKD